jgi:hypothetical protein
VKRSVTQQMISRKQAIFQIQKYLNSTSKMLGYDAQVYLNITIKSAPASSINCKCSLPINYWGGFKPVAANKAETRSRASVRTLPFFSSTATSNKHRIEIACNAC